MDNLIVGGISCRTFNDSQFRSIRSLYVIRDTFLEDFNFNALRPSSGKGGQPLARTVDGKYFVKQLTESDHEILRHQTFAKDYAEHIVQGGVELATQNDFHEEEGKHRFCSLLAPFFAHFSHPRSGKHYICMLNILPLNIPESDNLTDKRVFFYRKQYDMKGCADDRLVTDNNEIVVPVRKRFYSLKVRMGCGGRLRRIYKAGKLEALYSPDIPLSVENKSLVMEALSRDVEFLLRHNLMDYSLLAGVASPMKKEEIIDRKRYEQLDHLPTAPMSPGKPLLFNKSDSDEEVVFLGIIDYLQNWDCMKVTAGQIKFAECNKATVDPRVYADRFVKHFDVVLIGRSDDEKQNSELERIRDERYVPYRCFPLNRK